MKVTTTPLARSTVALEVELPADRIQQSIDESIRRLGRRTRVAGFRPGKAPRAMLERTLGVSRDRPDGPNPIYDEAKDLLIDGTLVEAIEQADIEPIVIPDAEWLSFVEGEGARYRLEIPVRPDVKLGDYTNFPFAPEVRAVGESDIDAVIDDLRDQHASLRAVEDRPIKDGDWVVIGFEATMDGQSFEGGKAERLPLVVGQDRMIPGFEGQLVGLAVGGEKDFELTYPDDYPDAALAGKPASFHVLVREVREKVLPDADDDLAGSVGAFEGLAALRVDIEQRLVASGKDRARHEFADRIVEYAVANSTVELPDLLVEQELDVMLDELRARLSEQGLTFEAFLAATSSDEAKVRAESRQTAEQRVKTLLVLSKIAEIEGIEIEEAAVDAEIARARTRYERDAKLMAYFESSRGRSYLRSTMRRSQVIEALVDRWLAAHPEFGPLPHLESVPWRTGILAGSAGEAAAEGAASGAESAEGSESAAVPAGRGDPADTTVGEG